VPNFWATLYVHIDRNTTIVYLIQTPIWTEYLLLAANAMIVLYLCHKIAAVVSPCSGV